MVGLLYGCISVSFTSLPQSQSGICHTMMDLLGVLYGRVLGILPPRVDMPTDRSYMQE